MYDTPSGDRILVDAERDLFTQALAVIVDFLADGDAVFGIAAFDELQRTQKLVVLYTAARGLLRPSEPPPKSTAFTEAAVATVFAHIKDRVLCEIDEESSEHSTFWRSLVLAASQQQLDFQGWPHETDSEMDSWNFLIECLTGCVLCDEDYESQQSLDLPPDESRKLHSTLGIAEDYYTDVPADPPDSQINLYLDALMGLTAGVR